LSASFIRSLCCRGELSSEREMNVWWDRKKLIKTLSIDSPLPSQNMATFYIGAATDARDCCHRVHIDRWKFSRRELNWLIKILSQSTPHFLSRVICWALKCSLKWFIADGEWDLMTTRYRMNQFPDLWAGGNFIL
jgi:hypothetical protein